MHKYPDTFDKKMFNEYEFSNSYLLDLYKLK